MTRVTGLAAATVLLAVLATANAGGYRYGVSDQAFYVPATVLAGDPASYPLDAPLIESQARLLVMDEILAGLASLTGLGLPALFLIGYVLTACGFFLAALALGRACRFSPWALATFGLLLTFRHRITRTGANSFEGYMHPRVLAFALGLAAFAALVRGRLGWMAACLAVAAGAHPTTALWFGIACFVGVAVSKPTWNRPLAAVALAGLGAAAWIVWVGPLAGDLVRMDEDWLSVLADKDYLFPTDWPAYAWLLNLAYAGVIVAVYRVRVLAGIAEPGERALVAGLLALVVVFVASVPFTAWRVALAVELQITRVFWLLDVVTAAYLAWWLVRAPRRRVWVVAVLLLASVGRGAYILTIEHPERALVRVDLAATDWNEAMAWIRDQPAAWHVLADPEHGWRYGTSVRVAAQRDTLVETVKDTAISLYDRDIAMRTRDRVSDVGSFQDLTAERARELGARYELDVVVVTSGHPLALPELFRNDGFVVYDLR